MLAHTVSPRSVTAAPEVLVPSPLTAVTPPTAAPVRPRSERPTPAEMMAVSTIAELRELYHARGSSFPSEELFLSRVRYDWMLGARETGSKLTTDVPASPLPLDQITVDGQQYGALGVWHTRFSGRKMLNAVNATIGSGEGWLHEQNLEAVYKTSGSQTVNDHAVPHHLGVGAGWSGFFTGILAGMWPLSLFVPGPKHPVDLMRDHPKLDAVGDTQLLGRDSKGPINMIRRCQGAPSYLNATGEMPPYVVLELKQREGVPFNHCQARSAYMAEVLRHWNYPGERKILVGQAHAAEVLYFLKHPVHDARIRELGRKDAELLNNNTDPKEQPLSSLWSYGGPALAGYFVGMVALSQIAIRVLPVLYQAIMR